MWTKRSIRSQTEFDELMLQIHAELKRESSLAIASAVEGWEAHQLSPLHGFLLKDLAATVRSGDYAWCELNLN